MRQFIDAVTTHMSQMPYRLEIVLTEHVQHVLEAYQNPEQDLELQFRVVYADPMDNRVFMELMVLDKLTQTPVVKVDYVLGDQNVVVSNVISFKNDKHMHTSMGVQSGATDLGTKTVRWLFKQILSDATKRGYPATHVSSTTRYSGARAAQGSQTQYHELPTNYSVSQKITERHLYQLLENKLIITPI